MCNHSSGGYVNASRSQSVEVEGSVFISALLQKMHCPRWRSKNTFLPSHKYGRAL